MDAAIVVAIIAALPGIGGLWFALRKERGLKTVTISDAGTKMAEAAFANIQAQVTRLVDQQATYDDEHDEWDAEKMDLLRKINEISQQLQATNQYLQLLLITLDSNGITRPAPPAGFAGTGALSFTVNPGEHR